MDDRAIIALLWQRDERAISELSAKHGHKCLAIAREIIGSDADAEECWNDACLAIWDSIPPQKPESLKAYALRICRNIALNRARHNGRQKRAAVFVELDECVSGSVPEREPQEIGRIVDRFLETLPKREAAIFLHRYFCSEPVQQIAAAIGLTENQISKILQKLRRRLKKQLEKEDIHV